MKTPSGTRSTNLPNINLLSTAILITLLGVAVPTVLTIGPLLDRWLALILLAAFGELATRLPQYENELRPAKLHLVLGLQSALLLALLLIFPQVDALITLFYILSIEAMLYLPVRVGLLWLLGYLVAAAVYLLSSQSGLIDSLIDLATFAGGMLLFGLVSVSLRSARLTQQRNEKLLGELQAANRQLQEYADQVETASVHAERNRLAREMHDAIGHRLTVASVQLEAASKLALINPGHTAELIDATHEQVREALNELRQTVGRLREPLEADLQLDHALPRLVESFRQSSSELTVHLEMPADELALPDTHRLALYRAAQEGLTNVQRHAAASQAWLRLLRLPASIQLEVEDNGSGLPADFDLNNASLPTSFGLRGMRERLDQLGGQMELERRAEGGTRLRVSLPLAQEKA